MSRTVRRVVATLAALVLACGLFGCSGDKPSKEQLREAITKGMNLEQYTGEERVSQERSIDCFVEELHSKLSADSLRKFIEVSDDPTSLDKVADALSAVDLEQLVQIGLKCAPNK